MGTNGPEEIKQGPVVKMDVTNNTIYTVVQSPYGSSKRTTHTRLVCLPYTAFRCLKDSGVVATSNVLGVVIPNDTAAIRSSGRGHCVLAAHAVAPPSIRGQATRRGFVWLVSASDSKLTI